MGPATAPVESLHALELWARGSSEPWIYAIFVAVFALCAVAETRWPWNPAPAMRRTRWSTNGLLTLGFVLVSGLLPVTLVMVADWAQTQQFGLLHQLTLAPLAAVLIGLLLRSFLSFYTHWLMHKVPWLWRVHRVHHADRQLDVSTTVRFHPLEPVLSLPFALLGIGLLGISPVAVLLYELLDAAVTVWSHANVRWPRGLARIVGWVLVTPDQHRVHHHPQLPWTDSNFGATLNLWDRLFGTFRSAPEALWRHPQLGLPDVDPAMANSLRAQLLLPWHRTRLQTET